MKCAGVNKVLEPGIVTPLQTSIARIIVEKAKADVVGQFCSLTQWCYDTSCASFAGLHWIKGLSNQ